MAAPSAAAAVFVLVVYGVPARCVALVALFPLLFLLFSRPLSHFWKGGCKLKFLSNRS